jgi:hypothetical protein
LRIYYPMQAASTGPTNITEPCYCAAEERSRNPCRFQQYRELSSGCCTMANMPAALSRRPADRATGWTLPRQHCCGSPLAPLSK